MPNTLVTAQAFQLLSDYTPET